MTEFREHGFSAAIAKPFTLEELNRTLHSLNLAPPDNDEIQRLPQIDLSRIPKNLTLH
jgi:hypothetical protein